ncbi:MAG: FAD-binding oxidoreductase [Pseudomonadota bacterium]
MSLNTERYTGWGRVLGASGRARPEKAGELARFAAQTPGPAIGARRAYGDAALSSIRPAVQTTRLDRMLAFEPETGILEAEAGTPLSQILKVLSPRGWMPPVLPGTGYATLGGAIAADVHGKNHHHAGSFGSHVRGVRLIGPDGTARQITAESDPALFAATLGGMGLTGIIESAKIALAPCPALTVDVAERRMAGLSAFLDALTASDATFSVGWIDATATGAALGRGILEEAEFTTRANPFVPRHKPPKPVPIDAPGFALSPPVVRLFNRLYLARIPKAGRRRTRPLTAFFHPLDGLKDWNRLYGKRGFHQFQCVVPPDATEALHRMLSAAAASRLCSPLAVLKRMGPGRAGPMSFPMEGFTLALDIPNRRGAEDLITGLLDRCAAAGGRVYLAKDSLARPDHIAAMYPELDAFRETLRAADPERVFETDLARRLALRGAP